MSYTIRYNRTTTHIEGCDAATQSTGEVRDGVVSYYAQSACGSLTRYGHSMGVGKSYEDAAEALEAGRANAAASGRKFCKKCELAAKWAVANAPFDPESDEFKAEKKRVNDELNARSEARKIKTAKSDAKCRIARYGTGDEVHLCTRTPEHTGNHRTAEGDEFTNWTEPVQRRTTSSLGRKLAKDHGLNFF